MMEGATTDEFWNQFVGSSSANVLTIMALGVFLGLKKLCNRDSRCKAKIHCPCIDVDVRDKTLRQDSVITDQVGPGAV